MSVTQDLRGTIISFLILNIIGIGLRVAVRIWKKTLSYDDWALLAAFVGFVVFSIFLLVGIHYGLGATALEPHFDLSLAAELFVISQLVYIISQCVAKQSAALVIFRIASNDKAIRKIITGSMAIMTLWSLVSCIMFGLQCRPLSVAWGVGTGECFSGEVIANVGYAISAMDIFFSWLYALMPIYLLWNAQISTRTKTVAIILLGMGVVSCIATVVRLKYLVEYSAVESSASAEAVQIALTATVYSVVDIGLVIFTASLAALKPLMSLMHWGSTTRDYYSKSGGNYEMNTPSGPRYRLEETSQTGSQDDILEQGRHGKIHKETKFEVQYDAAR